MCKKRGAKHEELAGTRKKARAATSGEGVPGRYNPTRSVRFNTPTDKHKARGRTHRGEDD